MAPMLLHVHPFHESTDRVKFLVFWAAVVVALLVIELAALGTGSLFR